MTKKIVMIDVDGVLLADYKTNKDVRHTVALAAERLLLVPNSDTPAARLRQLFEYATGHHAEVLIAELGAVVCFPAKTLYTTEIPGIPEFRKNLAELAFSLGAEAVSGNTVEMIRTKQRMRPNSRLILIDDIRERSIGFYIKMSDSDGLPYTNPAWSGEAMAAISSRLVLPAGLSGYDYNPDYGIAICNPPVTKTTGYRLLRQEYPHSWFYMIGDSTADIIRDPRVIQCAVGNAAYEYSRFCSYVADLEVTAGFEQCLNWILNHSPV